MSDYAKYIEDVAYAFAKVRRPEVSRERIAKDAKDIAYFETEIAKVWLIGFKYLLFMKLPLLFIQDFLILNTNNAP